MKSKPHDGQFKEGNQLWRLGAPRRKKFATPDDLWNACVGYFEWAESNPLMESRPFHHQGLITMAEVPKMRAFTQRGLCLHIGISQETWRNYGDDDTHKEYHEVVAQVESIIYEQKFTGAAADMLNPSIIGRELGLAEKQVNINTTVDSLSDMMDELSGETRT